MKYPKSSRMPAPHATAICDIKVAALNSTSEISGSGLVIQMLPASVNTAHCIQSLRYRLTSMLASRRMSPLTLRLALLDPPGPRFNACHPLMLFGPPTKNCFSKGTDTLSMEEAATPMTHRPKMPFLPLGAQPARRSAIQRVYRATCTSLDCAKALGNVIVVSSGTSLCSK